MVLLLGIRGDGSSKLNPAELIKAEIYRNQLTSPCSLYGTDEARARLCSVDRPGFSSTVDVITKLIQELGEQRVLLFAAKDGGRRSMLTLNKLPCFQVISSFSQVAVTVVEERRILHGRT